MFEVYNYTFLNNIKSLKFQNNVTLKIKNKNIRIRETMMQLKKKNHNFFSIK